MTVLYIASTNPYSGKSLIILGLGLRLKEDGLKIGYMKPLGKLPSIAGDKVIDEDAMFMKETLELDEPIEYISPFVLTQDLFTQALKGENMDILKNIKLAYDHISKEKDCVLIGGAGNLYDGGFLNIPPYKIIKSLNAKVLLIDPYINETCIDCIIAAKEGLGKRLIGVVLNRVLPNSMEYVKELVIPFLTKKGVDILGVLPQDNILNAITVRQVNDVLNGNILCCEERLSEMVENFSIGAMNVEDALRYFLMSLNKAVITGGDRSDIQLAAMETSTKCLILTGGQYPNDLIVSKAKDKGVPIISVKDDTLTTIKRLESITGKIRIRESAKVTRAVNLLKDNLDYRSLYNKLGLT
ncbi:MAG: phosphotransacetylase family protein [Nitrospirota bacterium]